MKKRDHRELCRYIRWVANELGLHDWTIHVMHEPAESNKSGNIHCTDGARECFISFAWNFRSLPAEEQRETVVHELLHAQHATCWHMVQSDLAEALGKPTYYVFCDSYRRAMEYSVDALAKAIAPRFPLIDWPKRKGR